MASGRGKNAPRGHCESDDGRSIATDLPLSMFCRHLLFLLDLTLQIPHRKTNLLLQQKKKNQKWDGPV
jgi:hypothetical protein